MNRMVTQETQAILTATEMTFAYPARLVFDQWSHGFGPGLTWVQGRNGEGKSTLLRIMSGALTPRKGSLSIQGVSAQNDPLEYRRRIFWCGPGAVPLDHLTPLEYFAFMAHLYPAFDQAALQRHLDAFGLHPHLRSALSALSTGTQRKVWISAALSAGTAVTLLDEPVNALDALSTQHLRDELKICAEDANRAWVIASHEDLGAAGRLAGILSLHLPGSSPAAENIAADTSAKSG
ncbi:N/A [soil metagenome]